MDAPSLHDALRRMPVLRTLPLGHLDRLVAQSELRDYRAGSSLLVEGEAGDELFALLAGRVAVRVALTEHEQGVIAVREAGELVGEMALLDDLPRSASVTRRASSGSLTTCSPIRRMRATLRRRRSRSSASGCLSSAASRSSPPGSTGSS